MPEAYDESTGKRRGVYARQNVYDNEGNKTGEKIFFTKSQYDNARTASSASAAAQQRRAGVNRTPKQTRAQRNARKRTALRNYAAREAARRGMGGRS